LATTATQDMFSLFRATCDATPDPPFLIGEDGAVLTYAGARARSTQLAHAFRNAGVQAGDRIAIQVEKSQTALLTLDADGTDGSLIEAAADQPTGFDHARAEADGLAAQNPRQALRKDIKSSVWGTIR
jgi:non-ribosomal peptide synthetase component F